MGKLGSTQEIRINNADCLVPVFSIEITCTPSQFATQERKYDTSLLFTPTDTISDGLPLISHL